MPPVMYLLVAVVGVRTFALGRAVFRYGERYFLHSAALGMLAKMRPELMLRLVPWAPAGYKAVNRQIELTRVVKDADDLQELSVRVIAPMVQAAVGLLFALGLAAWFLPWAILPTIAISMAAIVLSFRGTAKATVAAETTRHEARTALRLELTEYLENIDSIRAYQWQPALRMRIQQSDRLVSRVEQRSNDLISGVAALFFAFLPLSVVTLSVLAAEAVTNSVLAAPLLATFSLLSLALFDVLLGLQGAATAWVRYRTSAESVQEVLQRPTPAVLRSSPTGPLGTRPQTLNWRRLSVLGACIEYPSNQDAAIGPIDLDIENGSVIAIVGESGSGKTSIGYLLSGLLSPTKGRVESDGDRPTVGLLEQEPIVLAGTLGQNLRIGAPEASVEQLLHALDQFGLTDTFVSRGGLTCDLGERSLTLSGGEAARLAAARLWLANFDVYVLDEPSANLDRANATRLIQNFIALKRTLVVITHDPTLLENTEHIKFEMPAMRGVS